MTSTPNPGSDEAIKLGCTCPVAARLQELLMQRDRFIVERGLWQEFVDSLTNTDSKGETDE